MNDRKQYVGEMSKRLMESFVCLFAKFEQAKAAGDWDAAYRVMLAMLRDHGAAVDRIREAMLEADALDVELRLYRPTRGMEPPAPLLHDYDYVVTNHSGFFCAAKRIRKTARIEGFAFNYIQEHWVPDRKSLCGQKTHYPVRERFTSGGWPRLRELCVECTSKLVEQGLITNDDAVVTGS